MDAGNHPESVTWTPGNIGSGSLSGGNHPPTGLWASGTQLGEPGQHVYLTTDDGYYITTDDGYYILLEVIGSTLDSISAGDHPPTGSWIAGNVV